MIKYKSYLSSKTFWAALFFVLVGAYTALAPAYGWDTKWVPGVVAILTGLGLYGIRTADSTLLMPGKTPPPATPDNVVPAAVTPADIINGATLNPPVVNGLEDLK